MKNPEVTGIPPDIEAAVLRKTERDIGQDSGLNAALAELGIDISEL